MHVHHRGTTSVSVMSVRLTLTLAHAHAHTMADLDDMLLEFAHFQEQAEQAEPPESPDGQPPQTPKSPEGDVPFSGPEMWTPGTKVISTEFKDEVTFMRMGNTTDFINAGRVKISFEQVKKGAKFKKETHTRWVQPETLSLPPSEAAAGTATGGSMPSPSARKSPRIAERTAGRAQSGETNLTERAAHERERKLPQKPEAPVRGHQKMERTTAETKVAHGGLMQTGRR